jgi:parallel beta-helix repeat protein
LLYNNASQPTKPEEAKTVKVKVLGILISLAMCLSMFGVLGLPHPSPAIAGPVSSTWYVATTGSDSTGDGSEGTPWQTIQHAIDQSSAGDTIIVHDGTYAGATVNKANLTICSSDGPGLTIISDPPDIGFNVTMGGVTIDGFNITACDVGIMLENGADNSTIKNNIIEYNGCGVEANSEHNLIINNTITDNGHGIWIEADNNKVLGNNILNNTAASGSGVHVIGDLTDVCIEFNNIIGNSEGLYSYGVYSNSTSEDFTVFAGNNWWGNTTGPHDLEDNPEGTGDAVSGPVYYEPWLGAPLALPIHYEELVGAGPHVVDATAEADTTVSLSIAEGTDSLDIVIARYESKPFPDATFPDLSLGKFIDIGFPGEEGLGPQIVWPIRAEMTYTDVELGATLIDETTLGFYDFRSLYWDETSNLSYARRWAHTGVYPDTNTIWADLVPADFYGGAPFGTGGLEGPRIFADDIYVSDASGNDTWDGLSPTWISGTNGPKKTIQGGIDAVAVGGTVHVENGTYSVNWPYVAYIDKPNITIYSSNGPGAAIVSGPGDDVVGFEVDDSGATIDGFNITGFGYGIYLESMAWRADNCTIQNNIFENCSYDTIRVHTSGNILSHNTMQGPGEVGIYIDPDGNGNLIINNTITGYTYESIAVNSASGNKILGNNIENNGEGILFLYDTYPPEDNVIHFNNIAGNNYGLDNGYGLDVNADNNWWGSATGPTDSGNPGGTGDSLVGTNTTYRPWLGAPLVLPVQYETLSAGTYTVNATAEADTEVTLTISDGNQTDIYIGKYESQPFPQEAFPDTALGIYIDILVSNPDAVNWPIYVEVSYTDDEVTAAGIDESTLGLYYYQSVDTFHRCSDTGVDTANNIIWANVTQEEAGYLVGTPFGAGGQPSAPPPPPPPVLPVSAVPTLSQWGMIGMAILFIGACLDSAAEACRG